MRINFKIVVILILTFSIVSSSSDEAFTPTNEWQTIQEGQKIGAGLHVRINLETGKKEAKLISNDDKRDDKNESEKSNNNLQRKDLVAMPSNSDNSRSDDPTKNRENGEKEHKELKITKELEEALKNIPMTNIEYSAKQLEELNNKFRSYDEIKKDFANMKLNIKSDSEIITKLIEEYKNVTKDTELEQKCLLILEDLNYLVHQYDNALWFIQEGGLDNVLLPMIVNQTNHQIRLKSLRILGALSQNNPKAQIKVFEKNFGIYLSQILVKSNNPEELSATLYAFSSLLRKFPHAQQQILSKIGTKAIVSILDREIDLKIKAKAITLISDLLVEKEYSMNAELENDIETKRQYKLVKLESWLKDYQFCDIISGLLTNKRNEFLVETELADYFIQALQTTTKMCYEKWSNDPMLRHVLLTLRNRYKISDDDYLNNIAERIKDVIGKIFLHTSHSHSDEL